MNVAIGDILPHLREHDPNCAKYYQGDILRQIRICTNGHDTVGREKWLTKLEKSKQAYIKSLEGLSGEFLESLDALVVRVRLLSSIFFG